MLTAHHWGEVAMHEIPRLVVRILAGLLGTALWVPASIKDGGA
jgi:hypothetical protein